MSKYDLSILIPARNEMFVAKTAESLLRKKRGKTEVIIGLDGQWADPPLQDHPDLIIVYYPEALGQRAMTNQLCRLSRAKYVAKMDAHCDADEGFDVKLMADMQDNWTVLPAMYNFHVFDWVCIGTNKRTGALYLDPSKDEGYQGLINEGCGNRTYQGPTPLKCEKCGGNMERELIWKKRESRRNEFYRFDKTLHFQYWGSFKTRPEAQSELAPTLSIPGSFFMLTRQKYWELDICDEKHGSWGQQGVEVCCKTWLSGGQVMVNKKTWYTHMFRTQGGDFGFPYPISTSEQERARWYSRKLWLGPNLKERWPLALYDIGWLLEKFRPVPDWHDDSEVNLPNALETENPGTITGEASKKGIIFYTDNKLNHKIAHLIQDQLSRISFDRKLPIVSASLKPMKHFGKNIHLPLERGTVTYFKQIIAALEASDAEIIYFCEHDVIYHPSHFDFTPERKDMFYYNQHFWRIRSDGFAVHWDANQVSGLVAYRELALKWYKERLDTIGREGFNRSYEPGGRDPSKYQIFKSEFPNIDIRHEGTLTKSKWSPDDFRDKSTCVNWQESNIDSIPGWDKDTLVRVLPH